MYFSKFFKDEDICSKIYSSRIKNLKINTNTDFMSVADNECQCALSFYKFAINYNIQFLCTIINEIEIQHMELLCYELLRNEYIYLIVSDETDINNLKNNIATRIETHNRDDLMLNTIIYYNLTTHKGYRSALLKTRLNKVNQNNLPTWDRNIEANQYIAILFKEKESIYTPNYKLGIEIKDIAISNDPLNIILHKIVSVIQQYNFSTYNWFKYNNSNLIGTILATYPFPINDIKKTLHLLFKYDSVINMFTVFYTIFCMNPNRFKQVTNEAILNSIYEKSSNQLSYYDDNSNVEYMFTAMYAYFDTNKSHQLLLKGLNNSVCRPAFRKEDLIKYVLPDCLRKFAINNWYTESQLEIFALRIYDMLKVMSDTTDRGADLSFFKEVLLEYIPSSSLLDREEILNIKIQDMDNETENSQDALTALQKNNLTVENLTQYYECKIDGIDYSSKETWECLINFELGKDEELKKLFNILKNNHYPEPFRNKVNEFFPLITAVLLEKSPTKQITIDFILLQGGRSGLVNMIETSIVSADIYNGKNYFNELLLLCEMIVYPMNASPSLDGNKVDLISEIISRVEFSTSDDWFINENSERIFKQNPNVRIISHNFEERSPFHEEWATKHPDSHAYLYGYSLYYNSSLIKKYDLVSVDGGRATLPLPRVGTNSIARKDYRFALIINEGEILEYIHRSGLIIE